MVSYNADSALQLAWKVGEIVTLDKARKREELGSTKQLQGGVSMVNINC